MLMPKVVVGRDARISGPMIHNLVVNTLIILGIVLLDCTTPTVTEIAVPLEKLMEIILTASHNPKNNGCLEITKWKG
jgi:phosphomannomutase